MWLSCVFVPSELVSLIPEVIGSDEEIGTEAGLLGDKLNCI